ncbi:MAG: acyl-CoA synthetase [Alphaproteobacteria bacterium]|jgi:fatty-acyl-CoA synthase|nr:acyl-CoA synthetase [Alphaproteobacteria bacterium]MDP6257094.1 acyl-CoA synthetase [Alphaproteobacteria bacterium]MDP7056623.1 acyl-CoA synthetase [Alphaproteobacteria bacterium]MDP7230340.1 acyl-CoA synthetase [Alphaproteobacteria bacterium]MDP7458840.1 acyl-CoA synthetase [Alphaproteobacteria bacterium]|tara:strand:+ start:3140 stop:4996 length:1857 start_codon:yes stop_codon:yes gene_type:complete
MRELLRNSGDARALEQTPIEDLLTATNAFDAIRQRAEQDPDNIALKFLVPGDVEAPPWDIRYGHFIAGCYQTANMLHDHGLRPGEVVSFLLPLCEEAYCTIVGGEAAGIVNAVNPMLEDWQIVKILKAANTKILIAAGPELSAEIWDKVAALRAELPELAVTFRVGDGPVVYGVKPFTETRAGYPDDHLVSGRQIQPGETASYFHTGGTTGTPKLAQHTHYMQATQIWSTGEAIDYGPGDSLTTGLPLFHIGGSIVCGLVPLAHGTTLVVVSPAGFRDPSTVRDMWRLVERHRITILGTVPTVFGALLNSPVGETDISSLRHGFTGGAPLPTEVGRALIKTMGKPLLEGYGMTETTSFVTMLPRNGPAAVGSAGMVIPHCKAKTAVLDDDGNILRDCAVDEIGVVLMGGPGVTPGYVQEQYNAGALLADGWLNSGDLGRFDGDGLLWLTGRAKDLIIRGGHNIDPAVIEETLHQHPAVELAAAIGKPDSYAGELPIAYVQLKPGAEASAEELQAFAREHIPERAANPVNLFLIDVMPQTAVGKIFKPALRWDATERVFSELLAPVAEAAGAEINVSAGVSDAHGTLVTVSVNSARDREALAEDINRVLSPFTTKYQIS